MSNEIIVIKQLPVIEQQLAQIKEQVTERVETVTSLVVTEDTVKAVKKARAELGAEFKSWEEKRKEVKKAVITPYEKFEEVYNDCISNSQEILKAYKPEAGKQEKTGYIVACNPLDLSPEEQEDISEMIEAIIDTVHYAKYKRSKK